MQVAPKLHGLRVRKVQEQVKRWNEAGLRDKKLMCTARPSWLTMSTRTATFKEVCGVSWIEGTSSLQWIQRKNTHHDACVS